MSSTIDFTSTEVANWKSLYAAWQKYSDHFETNLTSPHLLDLDAPDHFYTISNITRYDIWEKKRTPYNLKCIEFGRLIRIKSACTRSKGLRTTSELLWLSKDDTERTAAVWIAAVLHTLNKNVPKDGYHYPFPFMADTTAMLTKLHLPIHWHRLAKEGIPLSIIEAAFERFLTEDFIPDDYEKLAQLAVSTFHLFNSEYDVVRINS